PWAGHCFPTRRSSDLRAGRALLVEHRRQAAAQAATLFRAATAEALPRNRAAEARRARGSAVTRAPGERLPPTAVGAAERMPTAADRKSTRLNSSHVKT